MSIKELLTLESLRKTIYKIRLDIITIISIFLIVVGIIIRSFFNGYIGSIIIIGGLLLVFFIVIIWASKIFLKDINLLVGMVAVIAIYVLVVYKYGEAVIEYVPKLFPENNKNDIMNLFVNSFSSFIGAIISIFGAFLAAVYGGKKSMEVTKKQMEEQVKKEEERIEKEKVITIRIIVKLLENEILYNYGLLQSSNIYNYLKSDKRKGYYIDGIKDKFRFEVYNNMKYDLLKYPGENAIEDVVDIYEMIYILSRYTDLGDLSDREFNKLSKLEEKISGFLDVIYDKQE